MAYFLILLGLNQMISLPRLYSDKISLAYSRDLVILFVVLVALPKGRLSRFWLPFSVLSWLIVVLFEWTRGVGVVAMKQSPLLYDAYFLAGHLYILLRDLMGSKATMLFSAVGLVFVLIGLLSYFLFRWVRSSSERLGYRAKGAVIIGVFGLVYMAEKDPNIRARNSLVDAVENVGRSVRVYNDIKLGVDQEVYEDLDAVELAERPRVHVYIVESYGRAVLSKKIKADFLKYRNGMAERWDLAGWHVATGLSEAPVMGGRSWLADATLLSGRTVKYESVYRHFVPKLSVINSIPKFFKDRGYRTVLMRPKDKARPGVELVNHFEFSDTVFHKDLDYQGRNFGWVEIPDQYALGHIRDVVMPTLGTEPEFVFAHLGSSHIPWDQIPPILSDWRKLNETGNRRVKTEEALSKKEIEFQLKRFKRQDAVRLRRLRPTAENIRDYFQAIRYSLEVVTRHILAMSDPPDLIVIMGDHQPPLYKKSNDFSVPVHVLARDRNLLKGFVVHGFRSGPGIPAPEHRIYHEGFFSLLVGALAQSQGHTPPQFHRQGFGVSRSQGYQ